MSRISVSQNGNNPIEDNIDPNSNNIKQVLDINKLNPSLLKVDSGTQLVKRKVVGGVLTGTGIAGLVGAGIAGTLVAVKVVGTGVVTALAGLVGAAAAPWVAIAIAGTAVAALIALTVTGIYLLATKPDDKDLNKTNNDLIQLKDDLTNKIEKLNLIENNIKSLRTKADVHKKRESSSENEEIDNENGENDSDRIISLMNELEKFEKDGKIEDEISELSKDASDLKKEIKNIRFQIAKRELTLANAAKGKENNLKKLTEELSTFKEAMFEEASQIFASLSGKKEEIDNEDKEEIDNEDKKEINNNNNDIKSENNNNDINNLNYNINEIKNEN